jgi:hypothetical protein
MSPEEMAQPIMEMYESLIKSINQAGGSGSSFTARDLADMTVVELIGKLATNNIRFVYTKYKPCKKEEPDE